MSSNLRTNTMKIYYSKGTHIFDCLLFQCNIHIFLFAELFRKANTKDHAKRLRINYIESQGKLGKLSPQRNEFSYML